MSKIIHVQTQVQTVFGELDDKGNVVQTFPVNLSVNKFEGESFAVVYDHLVKARSKLEETQ
jgi:hypothetical protein